MPAGLHTSLLRALGSRNTFNALAQEKTGDFWVNGRMFGSQNCHTAEDVHHCDLLFVLGCNPWIAHGFPNARDHLNRIRKDPARKLIVVDPRRTETAELADLHLAVRPGADAFLLGALLAILVGRGAIDRAFIDQRTVGFEVVRDALLRIPAEAWAKAADVAMVDLERCADMIAAAKAMVVRVELGIQQGVNSTLNSYLEKLLILLTGSFGHPGTNQLHSWLVPLWGNSPGKVYAPTGDEIIGGLLPPNSFAQAVLSDHPERLRAVSVDSYNPANTVQTPVRSSAPCRPSSLGGGRLDDRNGPVRHYVRPQARSDENTGSRSPLESLQLLPRRPALLPPCRDTAGARFLHAARAGSRLLPATIPGR